MALISCYECSKEISDKAPACPYCGAPAEIRSDHVEEPQVTQHQAIETEQQEELAPEPVPETPKKDEPFNPIVALAVGALVSQIVRALGISLGALTVVFLIVPMVLLVRYVKKQTTQVYAGIIGVLVVVMGIAVAAGPGDVFVPQAVETTSDGMAPQPSIRENTSTPQVESRPASPAISISCEDYDDIRRRETARGASISLEIVRHCAEQWHAGAMTTLGIRYAAGTGLPLDNVRAFMWLSLGHNAGSSTAEMFRDLTGAKMTPNQLDDALDLYIEFLEANPPR